MLSVAIALILGCFIIACIFENFLVLAPGIITGVALIVVSRFMERRTQKGADVYARCKGLRKWLTEFSALDERPAADVKVWGEFMVYAYLFGVAEQAIGELRKKVPEMFQLNNDEVMDSSYVPWWGLYTPTYYANTTMPDLGSMLNTSVSESIQAVQSALSGDSSDGSGGGGFSSGGGTLGLACLWLSACGSGWSGAKGGCCSLRLKAGCMLGMPDCGQVALGDLLPTTMIAPPMRTVGRLPIGHFAQRKPYCS